MHLTKLSVTHAHVCLPRSGTAILHLDMPSTKTVGTGNCTHQAVSSMQAGAAPAMALELTALRDQAVRDTS